MTDWKVTSGTMVVEQSGGTIDWGSEVNDYLETRGKSVFDTVMAPPFVHHKSTGVDDATAIYLNALLYLPDSQVEGTPPILLSSDTFAFAEEESPDPMTNHLGFEGTTPGRSSLRFSWDAVGSALIRDLLIAAYETNQRPDEATKVVALSDELLRQNAIRVLGRPMNARHMSFGVDVLREKWLPGLAANNLGTFVQGVQLGLAGPDRSREFSTKAELLSFLQDRRRTTNFKLQLRKFFLREHRVLGPAETTSTPRAVRDTAPTELRGRNLLDHRTPFDCQRDVWRALSALESEKGARSGLIVLPTGAGKTYTMVHWLLERMAAQPELRVLWLADRQELVDQAARTFDELAATMPKGFSRRMRTVHGNAGLPGSIADPLLDVAVVTRQSAAGSLNGMGRKRLADLLSRPTVVVIDEAHHAVSPTYEQLLTEILQAEDMMLVGMTATPWPSGYGAITRLRERFRVSLGEVGIGELIALDVLARPVFHTVETDVSVPMDEKELSQTVGRDIPPSVLRRLDQEKRNHVIYQAWSNSRTMWGKTLLFAVDIEHANTLGDLFTEHGAPVDVLHSEVGESAPDVLQRFRGATGPSVLISVGMLTEGVDVPDARTAFLARPTASRILMRQMIGRVLRGPAAGGESIAHVVDVRDRWDDNLDVLSPVEIPGISWTPLPPTDSRLPRLQDELTGEPIPEDLILGIIRQIHERMTGTKITVGMTDTTLTGYYQLDLISVPVFEHTAPAWRELIDSTLRNGLLDVRHPIEMFGDLPAPRPTPFDVKTVMDFLQSQGSEPPFREVRSSLSVRSVAQALLAAGALTEPERENWLQKKHVETLASKVFPTYQHFREAVTREVLALTSNRPPIDLENPVLPPGSRRPRRKLQQQANRELGPLLRNTAARGRQLLASEEEYANRLNSADLPAVEWTRRPIERAWAYWTVKIRGRIKGRTYICVNSHLRAPRSEVSDDLLEFLLWHELCHHLTPNQGHDAEFRRLEAMWPDAQRHDFALDEL